MSISKDKIKEIIGKATASELEILFLPKIMKNQTEDEINIKFTINKNRVGLNLADSSRVTRVYNSIKCGFHLTDEEVKYLQVVLQKYWRQFIPVKSNLEV